MQRKHSSAQNLVAHDEVAKVGLCEIATAVAIALGVKWSKVCLVLGIAHYHFALTCHCCAVTCNTCGEYAVEHVNAASNERKKVPGGFCGMAGCCGAAVSAGIFLSVILKATPMSKEEWALSNRMTSRCLEAVSRLGGPRCCKRDSYTTILAAAEFLREELGKPLGVSDEILCSHFGDNAECLKVECPYFPRT